MHKIKEIKQFAINNKVPIIQDDVLDYIMELIKNKNYKNILEIGSAIGYSSINLALINKDIKVVTIEKNKDMFLLAKNNIQQLNLQNQIQIIHDDALNISFKTQFDLIFIDAAKSKYIDFFEKFKNYLKTNGTIICDNIDLNKFKNKELTKNQKRLIQKMELFSNYLKDSTEFETNFITIGDGLSISTIKNKNRHI